MKYSIHLFLISSVIFVAFTNLVRFIILWCVSLLVLLYMRRAFSAIAMLQLFKSGFDYRWVSCMKSYSSVTSTQNPLFHYLVLLNHSEMWNTYFSNILILEAYILFAPIESKNLTIVYRLNNLHLPINNTSDPNIFLFYFLSRNLRRTALQFIFLINKCIISTARCDSKTKKTRAL